MKKPTKVTTIRVDEALLAGFDAAAARQGISRSAALKQLMAKFVRQSEKAA